MAAARPLLGLAAAAAEAAVLLLLLIGAIAVPAAECQVLVMGAYNETCPQAEDVVLKEMTAMVAKSPDLAAAVLRLFSLDCFVGGCEGSILLDSTPAWQHRREGRAAEPGRPWVRGGGRHQGQARRRLPRRRLLRRHARARRARLHQAGACITTRASIYIFIYNKKKQCHGDGFAVDETCTCMMHCLVDGQTKGPFIPLPTGRRDGNRSVAADVALFSPAPDANITDIINLFAIRFNLTAKDVAVLSGMLVVASSSYFPICCSVEEIGNFIIV